MTSIHKILSTFITCFLPGLFFSGCMTSTPTIVKNSSNTVSRTLPISKDKKLILITPKVEYIDTSTKKKLSGEHYKPELMARTITNSAYQILSKKGYPLSKHRDRALTKHIHTLFRTQPGAATYSLIDKTCGFNPQQAIVAHYLLVKIGGKGTWNANSGALTPNTNTTLLR